MIRFLFISVFVFISGNVFAQHSYQISGKVNALKDGDKIFLIYNLGDQQIVDSTLVKNRNLSSGVNWTFPSWRACFCMIILTQRKLRAAGTGITCVFTWSQF